MNMAIRAKYQLDMNMMARHITTPSSDRDLNKEDGLRLSIYQFKQYNAVQYSTFELIMIT